MATINQLVRKGRTAKRKKDKSRHLKGNPQVAGTVLRVMVLNPCKPNSAERHSCRVRLSNGGEVTCYVPGRGMNIQEHSRVLVRGGIAPDLRGVKYKVVRGNRDCAGVSDEMGGKKNSTPVPRKNSRSLYGVKK